MKRKRRVRKRKRNETGGKKSEKRVEIQEKEEQLMINVNEAKPMNEENWIETTNTMRKNLKKLMKKFVK